MGVFGSTQQWAGSSRADKMTFRIAGESVAGMTLQGVQFTFSQSVSLLFEIGSNYVYYIGGRAQGQASINRMIGPGRTQLQLLNRFRDICNPADLEMSGRGGACDAAAGVSYLMKNAVLTAIAGSVNANDVQINEQLTFMFVDMEAS